MEGSEDYQFLQIRDAIAAINQKVSLIGVVYEVGLPKETRGTDKFSTLKIIDESHPKPGISVNIFAESMEKLPHVASLGDIVQLSYVTMKTHNKEVYAVFNKKFSSFALYDGKDSEDFTPYQCSTRIQTRNQNSKFISRLRKWLIDIQIEEDSDAFLFLREIKEKERANLVCKVLHVFEVARNEWMALVWDGTDSVPITIRTKPDEEISKPLPLQLEPYPLPRNLLCAFPTVGTILRVKIAKGNEKHVLHLLEAGKWAKLLNLSCEVHAGLWYAVLNNFTKLRYVQHRDCFKLQSQRRYDERLSTKLGRIPYWCFPWFSGITEVDYDHVPFVTLMDVLTYSEVVGKFKCAVRVVASCPWQPEEFHSPRGTYRIRLTLEDPTARIHGFLYAEDGEKFFGGYPSIDVLTTKRNKLLGVTTGDGRDYEDAPRNPPWVQCCLKSYCTDQYNPWGSRQYRIFGTKNVC